MMFTLAADLLMPGTGWLICQSVMVRCAAWLLLAIFLEQSWRSARDAKKSAGGRAGIPTLVLIGVICFCALVTDLAAVWPDCPGWIPASGYVGAAAGLIVLAARVVAGVHGANERRSENVG